VPERQLGAIDDALERETGLDVIDAAQAQQLVAQEIVVAVEIRRHNAQQARLSRGSTGLPF